MTTAHKANSGDDNNTPAVTVILKTAEPDGVYVPYWQPETDFDQMTR